MPWRAALRLAGGDWNAVLGLAGLAVGIWIGTLFLKGGYNLGRTQQTHHTAGWMLPLVMIGLLCLLLIFPQVPGEAKSGVLFYSVKGPGAMHASLAVSLGVGLAIGFIAQRSRFCTMGAIRDFVLFRQMHLLSGFIALIVPACVVNFIVGQFKPGFEGQPSPTHMHLWNFAGWPCRAWRSAWPADARDASSSCPARGRRRRRFRGRHDRRRRDRPQFGLAALRRCRPYGIPAVIVGFAVCLFIGFTMRKKIA
jgi:YedE family putative selenium metabolism protein